MRYQADPMRQAPIFSLFSFGDGFDRRGVHPKSAIELGGAGLIAAKRQNNRHRYALPIRFSREFFKGIHAVSRVATFKSTAGKY